MSLVSEIEARHNSLQSTEEGRATQSFLLDGREEVEAIDSFEGMPPAFKYIDAKDRGDLAKRMIEQQLQESTVALKRQRVDNLIQSYKSLRDIGVNLDGRTLIELCDNVTILSRQDLVVSDAVPTPTPLLQDSSTPTHELDAAQRGRETGIVVVSAKIGLRVPQHLCGTVGKLMKKLYIKKYRLSSNFKAFIKRETIFNGRPGLENTYYARDEDIIEQAIREVMQK
ncbi:EsV-1-210/211 paralog [Ectocarpus siliculosus virus 1]|uniref:EsV-1-210/211 paralog n=1 Tax=Ectocarpus siliculosus virus 1 TaxID=37665 RepID=UPI0000161E55|nr:EsV-1-210/211 paralog [Ectocarpus siliculosus virus 1]